MRKLMLVSVIAICAAFATHAAAKIAAAKSIKDVMKEAHKGSPALCAKASEGKATKAEAETLVALYTDMGMDKPPKGDEASWKKKCDALIDASKSLVKDPAGKDGVAAYKAAVNCKGCHSVHK